MKVENLKIGRTYYMPAKYNPTSYTYGEHIAITADKKAVLVNKKGEQLTYHQTNYILVLIKQ